MASTPPAEPESEPADPVEPEEREIMQEEKGESTPLQDGVDNEQNTADVGYSADEAGNPTESADVLTPGSADGDGIAGSEVPQPPVTAFSNVAQDRPQPGDNMSSQQELVDADTHAKNSSQEQGYPTIQGGRGNGAHEEDMQLEQHFDGSMESKPQSPVGFGVEDDCANGQSEPGGAEGLDSGGYGGRGGEDDGMHPMSSQPPRGRHGNDSGGNDHTGRGGSKGFGDGANDDSGSRGRRMFDGSRVAEPDDVQIVDAGEGADVIPGVDDLPVFANDQSKALNDEIKVRERDNSACENRGHSCLAFVGICST